MVPENSRYLLNCRRSIGNGDFTASLRRVTQRTNARGWFINKPRQPFQEGSDKNKARFQGFSSSYKDMSPECFMRICKTGTLAATLVVPMLAHADPNGDNGNYGQNSSDQNVRHPYAVIRDVDPLWVLIPILSAVLLFSWRRFSRSKR